MSCKSPSLRTRFVQLSGDHFLFRSADESLTREDSMNCFRRSIFPISFVAAFLFFTTSLFSQETTAGLQGTVKDPSGAVVPHALVVVTGTTLVGDKQTKTDSNGYYRFANLPPGTYSITVKAEGFKTVKQEGTELLVGHLPTLDFTL